MKHIIPCDSLTPILGDPGRTWNVSTSDLQPSSFLLLVVMPGATTSFLLLVAMPFVPSRILFLLNLDALKSLGHRLRAFFVVCVFVYTPVCAFVRMGVWELHSR